jgi:hypothetical protein
MKYSRQLDAQINAVRMARGHRSAWSGAGREPSVDSMLADPIVHLVMRRDGVNESDVWRCVEDGRRALRARGGRVARKGDFALSGARDEYGACEWGHRHCGCNEED